MSPGKQRAQARLAELLGLHVNGPTRGHMIHFDPPPRFVSFALRQEDNHEPSVRVYQGSSGVVVCLHSAEYTTCTDDEYLDMIVPFLDLLRLVRRVEPQIRAILVEEGVWP